MRHRQIHTGPTTNKQITMMTIETISMLVMSLLASLTMVLVAVLGTGRRVRPHHCCHVCHLCYHKVMVAIGRRWYQSTVNTISKHMVKYQWRKVLLQIFPKCFRIYFGRHFCRQFNSTYNILDHFDPAASHLKNTFLDIHVILCLGLVHQYINSNKTSRPANTSAVKNIHISGN